MHQWVKEFHKWYPPLRVAILHDSGSYTGRKNSLIKSINNANGVLITSYSGIVSQRSELLGLDWDYVILDEGKLPFNAQLWSELFKIYFKNSILIGRAQNPQSWCSGDLSRETIPHLSPIHSERKSHAEQFERIMVVVRFHFPRQIGNIAGFPPAVFRTHHPRRYIHLSIPLP